MTLHKINKKYKDRLFRLIFQGKKDLLELYNAINNSDYTNPEDLTITTIEDVVYMGMKNDLSFLIDDVLNLYEHQSSYSPNLPLRGLFYFSSLYREQIEPVNRGYIRIHHFISRFHSILFSTMGRKKNRNGRN